MRTPTQDSIGKFNKPLYDLRMSRGESQKEFGDAIGYDAHTIMRIENGKSGGKLNFWRSLQDACNIPDSQMWALMNGKEVSE